MITLESSKLYVYVRLVMYHLIDVHVLMIVVHSPKKVNMAVTVFMVQFQMEKIVNVIIFKNMHP